jgi:hypothetical protein
VLGAAKGKAVAVRGSEQKPEFALELLTWHGWSLGWRMARPGRVSVLVPLGAPGNQTSARLSTSTFSTNHYQGNYTTKANLDFLISIIQRCKTGPCFHFLSGNIIVCSLICYCYSICLRRFNNMHRGQSTVSQC